MNVKILHSHFLHVHSNMNNHTYMRVLMLKDRTVFLTNSMLRCALTIVLLTLSLFVFCDLAHADWVISNEPLVVKVSPENDAIVMQNPPRFSWSRSATAVSAYEVSIRHSSGKVLSLKTTRNWLLPSTTFAAGEYTWRVRAMATGALWSAERHFVLSPAALNFVVPEDATLIAHLHAKKHPRSLPINSGEESAWRSAVVSRRQAHLDRLEHTVLSNIPKSVLVDSDMAFVARAISGTAWAASLTSIRQRVDAECRQLRASSLLWRLTQNKKYLDEARRRGNAIAALDHGGATSYENQDQATRNIAWSLTLALDYLATDLPITERNIWLTNIKVRANAIRADLVGTGWRLEQQPFDSHGSTNIGYLTAIATLLVGDIPEAEQWFKDSFRMYAQYISPWGGEDGGFANGTAYAEYTTDTMIQLWDPIHAATGVNFFNKPWSQGLMRYFVNFVPPGSSSHLFGDEAEFKPTPLIKSYVTRIPDPLAAWYAKNLVGDEDSLTLLAAPLPLPVESVNAVAPTANAYFVPSIGWVAMHSALADRSRNSVYFKSSGFGSFNHSHGDQNSFVLVSKGRPILVDSGQSDWYGSPHWSQWYRQTAAHNAITYDGGKGQVVEGEAANNMLAKGSITLFNTGADLDVTEGDAKAAYGGVLSKAIRRLWYVRDLDVLVVWDRLQGPQAHIYEWNMHSPVKFEQTSTDRYKLVSDGKSVCINTLWPMQTRFTQTSGYKVQPQISKMNSVWHARIESKSKTLEEEFLHVISIGCNMENASAVLNMSNRELKIGKHILRLN